MRERWRHLSANARFGPLQVILVVLLVATVSVVPPVIGGTPYLIFTGVGPLGLVLPYFIRELLVDHDAPKVVLRWAGPAIVISLGVFREQIKGAAPLLQAGVLFVVAAYISSYFWLMSDSRIVVVRK